MAVNLFKYFLTCSVFPYLFISTRADSVDELLSVVVIYRHGDRTPVEPYPKDPYRNASYWPEGLGQLTNLGKQQHFQLGKWLRARYDGFLSARYSVDDIYVRSTDVDRTLMSAEANLAGLYPPEDDQVWNRDIPWQPIPIHTIPQLQDPVLAMKKNCPKYNKLLTQLFKSPYFVNVTHRNHDLYAYLSKYSGTAILSLEEVEYLYNTLYIESLKNLTLPDWTKPVFPNKLKPWASLSFATSCYTKDLARLKTGLLFNEIISHFQNRTTDDYRKFLVFSGHDTTIANVLNTVGAFEYHCPPYASTILFELWSKENGTLYVNSFYKNSTKVQNITVKSCTFNCKFSDFKEILKPIALTLDEWEWECHMGWIEFVHDHSIYIFIIAIIAISIIIISIFVYSIKFFRVFENQGPIFYTQLPNDEVA